MGLGSLILLPKQLRELGCTYVFHPGYHGNADTTIKFCRPFIVFTKSWYLYCQSSPLGLLIINYLTLVTLVTTITWKKVHEKLRSLYFHVIKKPWLKEIGIPFYIRLLYSFCVLFIAL